MKQTTKMSRAVCQLEKMYNTLNHDFWNDELEVPIITVQSKAGSMGHCTVSKVWKRPNDSTFELNIAAEVLNYPIEETLDTILHEMVHLYCRMKGIQECSRGGSYHNGKFKELAEKVGLKCYKTEKYGWNTVAKDNDKLIEYALSKDWSEILIGRNAQIVLPNLGGINIQIPDNGGKKQSNVRKYQCPKCKNSVRATKDVNIICGDCNETMIKV